VRDHTSLRAWQEAHALSIEVIKLCYTFGESRTFTRHLGIAYGSAVETGELLRLAVDAGVVPGGEVAKLLRRTGETERILLGMLKHRRQFQK